MTVFLRKENGKSEGSISWPTWTFPIEGKAVTHGNICLLFPKSQRKKVMKSNVLKTVLLLPDQARSGVRADGD